MKEKTKPETYDVIREGDTLVLIRVKHGISITNDVLGDMLKNDHLYAYDGPTPGSFVCQRYREHRI